MYFSHFYRGDSIQSDGNNAKPPKYKPSVSDMITHDAPVMVSLLCQLRVKRADMVTMPTETSQCGWIHPQKISAWNTVLSTGVYHQQKTKDCSMAKVKMISGTGP